MPRKATGKPAGRPQIVLREDGKPDPIVHRPSPKAKRALVAELHFYRLQEKGRADDKPWPVLASASRVARRARVEPRTVQKLRKEWWYECHFWSQVLNMKVNAAQQIERKQKALEQIISTDLEQWLWKSWPMEGFIKSPLNGRCYRSPKTYARHLRLNHCVPFDWMSIFGPRKN